VAEILLRTKLYIPPLPSSLVSRSGIIDQLNQGLHLGRKLILVSAPAGFGKTTLVTDWLHNAECRGTWLSLDEGDNDPARFFAHLLAALQQVDDDIGHAAQSMFGGPQLPPMETLVTTLLNDISAVSERFALVLDDFHTIHLKWVHEAIAYLISHQPPQMHTVLITREDPPLPLPRLRVRGQVTELRGEDLRFSAEDAAEFLTKALGFTLDADLITALEKRTAGWVAGLQLAVLSMQRRSFEEMAAFVETFSGSHRYVIDYLAEEVLWRQPEELREFLIQTSILDRMSAPLGDAVTGRKDSEAIIRRLERANLFLVPLDDHRKWYRYHRLFADFLRTELDKERQIGLHLKAARWFASHELLPEAIHHAFASGDKKEAARMVVAAAEDALRSASFMTLLNWLNALPDELVQTDFELAVCKGFLLFLTREFAQAAIYVAAAERNLPLDAPPSSRGRLLSLRAHDAMCNGVVDSAVQLSREALDHLDDTDVFFRSQTLNVLGQVLQMQGDIGAAADVYREAVLSGRQASDQQDVIHVLFNLVGALNELGQRREALAICQQAIEGSAAQPTRASPWTELAYLVLGLLSYEANELDLAREQMLRALDSWGLISWRKCTWPAVKSARCLKLYATYANSPPGRTSNCPTSHCWRRWRHKLTCNRGMWQQPKGGRKKQISPRLMLHIP
jgi:LuxR family maltose regulon positive regulatory protein